MNFTVVGARPRRELGLAVAVYATLLCLAYGNVIFRGKSLVYSDNFNPLREGFRPAGARVLPPRAWTQQNLVPLANFHDGGATMWQWEPAGPFLRRALRGGEMPFWDPYVGGGVPSMANQTAAYFFPPSLLVVLSGNTPLLKNAYFLAIALSAGLFTYLVLRRHDVSLAGSLAAGAIFMFSGGLVQNIGSFIGQTVACIPAALFATIWFLENPTWKRCAALSGIYACVALASAPPFLAQALGIAALYALARIAALPRFDGGRARSRAAIRWTVACLIGAGLVAWYYLPAFALVRSSPQTSEFYSRAAREFLPLRHLFELLSPSLMDGSKIFRLLPNVRPRHFQIPYLGAVACLLALLASPREGKRRFLGVFAVATAGLVALKLFGAPPVQWIARVPGLKTIHYAAYFGIGLGFLLALLAGLGVDSLLRSEVGAIRGGCAAAAIPAAVLALKGNVSVVYATIPLVIHQWEHKWKVLLLVVLVAAALAAIAVLARRKPVLSAAAAILLALLASAEGVRNARFPRQFRLDVWRKPPPYVAELERDGGLTRCFTVGALTANTNSAFGIFSLDSLMTFNPPRIFRLYRRYAGVEVQPFLRQARSLPPEALLDRANIGFIVDLHAAGWASKESEARGFRKIFDDGFNAIFRRPTLPRYFFTSDFRIESPEAALEDVAKPGPSRQVILESPPSFPRQANSSGDPAVTVPEFHLNRFTLSFVSPRPGLVACSENDFPGWAATVNGRPERIVPVNYAFRGVEVPAGKVEIRFRYWPPGLTAGLAISPFAVVALLLAVNGRKENASSEVQDN